MESHEKPEFKRILVAVDGSDYATRAAKVAVTLAKKSGAELIVCHVIPTPSSFAQGSMVGPSRLLSDYFVAASKEAEKVVEEVVRLAEIDNVKATSLILQNVFSTVEAIVTQAANKDVDLIVVGTRGLSGFRKLLLGSVSSGVVTHAHCSVLVVR